VVVPVFNQAEYLNACLGSLATQTFADWECIVVDDGSTDSTREVFARFDRRRGHFQYLHQNNSGVSNARNRGLAAARGEWVAFLDGDDLYFPRAMDYFRECAENLSLSRQGRLVRMISGKVLNSHQEPDPDTGSVEIDDLFLATMHFVRARRRPLLQGTIFAQSLLAETGGFDPGLATSEDRELLARATAASPVALLDALVAHYRTDHGVGKSDRHAASGGKLGAHRHIVTRLQREPLVRRRFAEPDQCRNFERLCRMYLGVVDAAEHGLRGDWRQAAERLLAAGAESRSRQETAALLDHYAFFFRHPSSRRTLLARRCLAALGATAAELAETTGTRRMLQRRMLTQMIEFPSKTLRQTVRKPQVALDPSGQAALPIQLGPPRFALEPVGGDAGLASHCGFFRTAEEHLTVGIARCTLPAGEKATHLTALQRLYASESRLDAPEPIFGRTPALGNGPSITTVVVVAGAGVGRCLTTLRNLVDNLSAYGRRPELLVMGNAAPHEEAVELRALAWLAGEIHLPLRYAGLSERRAFGEILARDNGLTASELAPALGFGRTGIWQGSALFNAVLLDTLGEAFMLLTPGTDCLPARLRSPGDTLLVSSAPVCRRKLLWERQSQLDAAIDREAIDLLGEHERYLGRSVADVLSSHRRVDVEQGAVGTASPVTARTKRIVATAMSAYGRLPINRTQDLLLGRDWVYPGLLSDQPGATTGRTGYGWHGTTTSVLSPIATVTADGASLWHPPEGLPPVPPLWSSAPALYGAVLAAWNEDLHLVHLPLGLLAAGTAVPPRAADRCTTAIVMEAAFDSYRAGTRDPSARMAALADDLRGHASSPPAELRELTTSLIARRNAATIESLESLLVDYDGRPRDWARDVRTLKAALKAPRPSGDPVLASGAAALGRYAELLSCWPGLIRCARRMRRAGLRLSRSLTPAGGPGGSPPVVHGMVERH
jgi:hypothetical protein